MELSLAARVVLVYIGQGDRRGETDPLIASILKPVLLLCFYLGSSGLSHYSSAAAAETILPGEPLFLY